MTISNVCPTCHIKKAGRKPKYTNDEDRKKAKQEQTKICAKNYYEVHRSSIIERRRELSLQKKEEKLINLFFEKLNKLNLNKLDVAQKIIKYLHV